MENEKKKLNKSSKDYTNSMAAYNCNSCDQQPCTTPTSPDKSYNEDLGKTLQLPYWR